MAATGPVYFWGRGEHEYLSQFHALTFTAPLPNQFSITARVSAADEVGDEATFRFNEQYMMYSKAVLFCDYATAARVLQASNPKECKALGRQVVGFNERVWDMYKEGIVERGNWWKFTRGQGRPGEVARDKLLATGYRELVEASPYDRIWGIGFVAKDADQNRGRWGQNLLGKALMRVREELRSQQQNQKQ